MICFSHTHTNHKNNKIKIVLANDHHVFLHGLYSLLSKLELVEILVTANNGRQLLEKMKLKHHINVAVVDLHMEVLGGIEITRLIKQKFPA
ncbi:MAG: response regulator [Cyclobacteriaceae bacterium]